MYCTDERTLRFRKATIWQLGTLVHLVIKPQTYSLGWQTMQSTPAYCCQGREKMIKSSMVISHDFTWLSSVATWLEYVCMYTKAYRRQLLSMVRPKSDQKVSATSCTLYPYPPATPAALYDKAEGVSSTCVLQPLDRVQGTTRDLHYFNVLIWRDCDHMN